MVSKLWDEFDAAAKDATKAGPGGRYLSVDFHFHTPASGKDYKYKGEDAYERIADELAANGVEAVFVTDHNEWSGIEKLRAAIKKQKTRTRVYPGAELTLSAPAINVLAGSKKINILKFHCLVLLPDTDDAEDRLKSLITNNHTNDAILSLKPVERLLTQPITEIAAQIREWGGLFLPAHLHQGKKAEKSRSIDDIYTDGMAIELLNECFDAVEIRNPSTDEFFDGEHRGDNDQLIPEMTCVLGSDAHHPDEIGSEANYILVEKNKFEDIKSSLQFRDRVLFERPLLDHSVIEEVLVDGAFVPKFHIRLNACMSVLIGTKGAGKTAILECARFGLGYPPPSGFDVDKYLDHLLGPTGRVFVKVRNSSGQRFLFRRARPDSTPTIATEGGTTLQRDAVIPSSFSAEFKGWGEVTKLAEDEAKQLTLIDSFDPSGDLKVLARTIETTQVNLPGLFVELKRLKKAYRIAKEVVDELTLKEERLARLKSEKLTEEQAKKEKRDTELATYWELVNALDQEVSSGDLLPVGFHDIAEPFGGKLSAGEFSEADIGKKAAGVIDNLLKVEEALILQREKQIDSAKETLNALIEALAEKFAPLDASYQEKVAALDPNDREVLMERNKIVKEIAKLPSATKRAQEAWNLLKVRLNEYAKQLNDLQTALEARTKTRTELVGTLNKRLEEGQVGTRLELVALGRTSNLPKGAAANTYLREVAEEAMEFTESTVLKAQLFFMGDRPEHRVSIDDRPTIKFEQYENTWRPTQQLSAGQKSTAVLPLLVMLGTGPVVLDQPEDNLDNKYIGSTIAPHLLSTKRARQFLLTSHNASLVVMSDAELVIEIKDENKQAMIEAHGFLAGPHSVMRSPVLEVLDGGETAFKKRFAKYGFSE